MEHGGYTEGMDAYLNMSSGETGVVDEEAKTNYSLTIELDVTVAEAELIEQNKDTVMFKAYADTLGRVYKMAHIKNADYSNDNISIFGMRGVVVRLSDKITRLRNLIWNNKSPMVDNERVDDTFLDTVGYSIIGYLVSKNLWGK